MTDPAPRATRLVRLEEITPAYEDAAYFNVSLAPLVAHLGLEIFEGYDDLDDLQFAFLTLPSGETVTLTEYAGVSGTSLFVDLNKQENIVSIPEEIKIPRLIFESCQYLRLSRSEIEWIHENWQEKVDILYAHYEKIEPVVRPEIDAITPIQEREPIECFYYALKIYPRDRIPEYWAMLQHNLGLAYYHRTQGERWQNLQQSIACFNKSLEVFGDRDKYPQKWQINQEDLQQSWEAWNEEKPNLIRDILDRGGQKRNLSGIDLSGTNLSGANLSDADLNASFLQYADLSYANLSGADLTNGTLSETNLSDADLSCARLCFANLLDAKLSNANLNRADLSCAYLNYDDLSGANLDGANLKAAYLNNANLSGANLTNANLSGANLTDADLSGASVNNAQFGYNQGISELRRRDLILRGAIFSDPQEDPVESPVPVPR